jgi:hypothetical protein
LNFYEGPLYDATHLYDQSGKGRDLLSAAPIGTTLDGDDIALMFDPLVPNNFTRGDALGLAADPALTLVWKMRCTNDAGSFPTLLSLGTPGSSELNGYFDSGVFFQTFSGAGNVEWFPLVTSDWSNWVLTKPAGGGYANTWRLYRDGVALGAPTSTNVGALALGNTGLILGDFNGGGYPFGGHLAGMLVFEREFSGADLAAVQSL